MALTGWNPSNKYEIAIDSTKIDEDLTSFPLMVPLGSGVASIFDSLTPASGTDTYTKLLLHSKVWDQSINNRTATVYGGSIHPSSGKFEHGFYFNGTDAYIDFGDYEDYEIGSFTHWTIDFWMKLSHDSTDNGGIGKYSASTGWLVEFEPDNKVHFYAYGVGVSINDPNTWPNDTWAHYAVVRNGSLWTMYRDGTAVASGTGAGTVNDTANSLWIGRQNFGTRYTTGYLDEVRISKQISRWTSNFTPPTSRYTENNGIDDYTTLVFRVEGDVSSSSHQTTFLGDINVDIVEGRFYGGYEFDGSGDFIRLPDDSDWNIGSGDFTIDCWIKVPNVTGYKGIFASATDFVYGFLVNGNRINYFASSNGSSWDLISGDSGSFNGAGTIDILANAWTHVVFTRNGNKWYGFVNGVKDIDLTIAGTVATKNEYKYIGRWGGGPGNYPYNGSIAEFRFSKGISRWTENFIPPTSPYGTSWENRKKIAITTNVQSPGIYDDYTKFLYHPQGDTSYSGIHDITVHGDPEILAEGPEGFPYSISLDGTADRLTVDDHADFDFGTGEFTLEGWTYNRTIGTSDRFIAGGNNSDGANNQWFFGKHFGGAKLNFGYWNGSGNTETDTAIITWNTYTWYHWAVTRSGANLYIFWDGQLIKTWNMGAGTAINTGSYGLIIGARYWNGNPIEYMNGNLSEVRVSKGIARWMSNFTPPSAPYSLTTVSGIDIYTKLLIHPEGDVSPSKHSIQFNGDADLSTTSPNGFNNSVYFDGNDYLSVDNDNDWNFDDDDFTIDLWIKFDSVASNRGFVQKYVDSSNGWWLMFSTSIGMHFACNSGGSTLFNCQQGGISGWVADTWYHVAVVRNGDSFNIYRDGISIANATDSDAIPNFNADLQIGIGNAAYHLGHITELRISKGIARWTTSFSGSLPEGPYERETGDLQLPVEIESWEDFDGPSQDLTKAGGIRDTSGYSVYRADSEYSSTYDASEVFDNSTSGWWNSDTAGFPHWIGTKLAAPDRVTSIRVYNYSSSYHAEWFYVQGSNDKSNESNWELKSWTTITTVTGSQSSSWNLHRFENDTSYQYYRLYATENYGGNNEWAMHQIEFRSDPVKRKAILWTKVPTVYSGTNTVLTLYYDSSQNDNIEYVGDTGEDAAQNVWDSNFAGVWHMAQVPTSDDAVKDSSKYKLDLDINGTAWYADKLRDSIAGNKAIAFDSTADYFSLATTSIGTRYTLNVFYRYDTLTESPFFVARSDSNYSVLGGAPPGTNLLYSSDTNEEKSVSYSSWDSEWHQFNVVRDDASLSFYMDAIQQGATQTFSSNDAISFNSIGAYYGGGTSDRVIDGSMAELQISTIPRSEAWNKAMYYNLFGELTDLDYISPIFFYFTNPIPSDLSKVYGISHTLYLTVTVTGIDPAYVYDATFYDGSDVQIGSTVSGVPSGNSVSVLFSTPEGIDYNWYVTATSSGISDTSKTYTFTNKFLCAGYVEENGIRASGFPVRVYRRSTGELVGSDITISGGTFTIDSTYNEYHYAVAIHPTDTSTNSLIYDWLIPE